MKRLCNVKCVMFNALFLLYTLHFTLYTAYAQAITSTDLINNARDYDGKTVVYQGEVIGDVMARGNFVWVNVFDSKNAIGVWLPKELARPVIYKGSFKYRGDWVEVQGVFNRACSQHGGDLDIHAASLTRVESGRPLADRVSGQKIKLVIILGGILLCLLILQALKILQRRKSPRPKT